MASQELKLKRRSSILKDVGNLAENDNPDDKTVSTTARQSFKRVSFADTTSIKMFMASRDANTQWCSSYEEPVNIDSSMEITSIGYQDQIEVVSMESKSEIEVEKLIPKSTKSDVQETENCNPMSDFLSNFIAFKSENSTGGNLDKSKLGSSSMDITCNFPMPEIQQSFADYCQNEENMEMTCNVNYALPHKSFTGGKNAQIKLQNSNATSQINDQPMSYSTNEDKTCNIPCDVDITLSGSLNKSMFQEIDDLSVSFDSRENNTAAINYTDSKGSFDDKTLPNAMMNPGSSGEELDKNESDSGQNMSFTCHGKIELVSHSEEKNLQRVSRTCTSPRTIASTTANIHPPKSDINPLSTTNGESTYLLTYDKVELRKIHVEKETICAREPLQKETDDIITNFTKITSDKIDLSTEIFNSGNLKDEVNIKTTNSEMSITTFEHYSLNNAASKNNVINIKNCSKDEMDITSTSDALNITSCASDVMNITCASDRMNITNHNDSISFTTCASNDTNIATCASNDTNIATCASNDTNIATCASNDTNIAACASSDTNIATCSSNATNIATCSSNATNISSCASNAMKVTTCANDATNIATCGSNSMNITACASNAMDIASCASNDTNIASCASNDTNITTCASNDTNITTCASKAMNITTCASKAMNITTCASNDADIATCASNDTNITTCASKAMNITTCASKAMNITTCPSNDTNITTCPSNDTNITTCPSNDTNITTCPSNDTNITTCPSNDTNITTCPSNDTNITTCASKAMNITTCANNATNISTSTKEMFVDTHMEDGFQINSQPMGSVSSQMSNVDLQTTKANSFNLDILETTPPSPFEIAGLLTAPITNKEKNDINLSFVCENLLNASCNNQRNFQNKCHQNCDVLMESSPEFANLKLDKKENSNSPHIASNKKDIKDNQIKNLTILSPNKSIFQTDSSQVDYSNGEREDVRQVVSCQNTIESSSGCSLTQAISSQLQSAHLNEGFETISKQQSFAHKKVKIGSDFEGGQSPLKKKKYENELDLTNHNAKLNSSQENIVAQGKINHPNSQLEEIKSDCETTGDKEHLTYGEDNLLTDITIELVKDDIEVCEEIQTTKTSLNSCIGDNSSPEKVKKEEPFDVKGHLDQYKEVLSQFDSVVNMNEEVSVLPNSANEILRESRNTTEEESEENPQHRLPLEENNENNLYKSCVVHDKNLELSKVQNQTIESQVLEENLKTTLRECSLLEKKNFDSFFDKEDEGNSPALSYSDSKIEVESFGNNLEATSDFCSSCRCLLSKIKSLLGFDIEIIEDCLILSLHRRRLKIFLHLINQENHEFVVKANWAPQHPDLRNPCAKLAFKTLGHLISRPVEDLTGSTLCAIEDHLNNIVGAYEKVILLFREITFIHSTHITEFLENGMSVIVSNSAARLSLSLQIKFSSEEGERDYPRIAVEPRVTIGCLKNKDIMLTSEEIQPRLVEIIKEVDFFIANKTH